MNCRGKIISLKGHERAASAGREAFKIHVRKSIQEWSTHRICPLQPAKPPKHSGQVELAEALTKGLLAHVSTIQQRVSTELTELTQEAEGDVEAEELGSWHGVCQF